MTNVSLPPPSLPEAAGDLDRVGSRELEDRIAIARARGIDVLPLEGSPKLTLPDHIRAAAAAALERPAPQPSEGAADLRAAIAELWLQEVGRPLQAGSLLVTNGAMHALNLVFRAILAPGDNVVIPAPNFFFSGAVALTGAEARYVDASSDGSPGWAPSLVERACDARTRAIVFSNPVNPSGYLPAAETLEEIVAFARGRGLLVLSDESYNRYVYDGSFATLAALPGFGECGIVIRSFSKAYALAPLRVGFVVAPDALTRAMTHILEWEILYVSEVAQRAAAAAITGPQDWLQAIPAEYRSRRDRVHAVVAQHPLLSAGKPAAAPFLFLDVESLQHELGDPVEALLAHGIPTVAGRYFGVDGHVRLPFGGSPETVAALCNRLARVGSRQ